MIKIRCPKCHEEIELGKDNYNELLSEIKAEEIEKQLKQKEEDLKKVYDAKLALETTKAKSAQDALIQQLQTEKQVLTAKLESSNKDTEIAVNKAVESLKQDLTQKDNDILGLKAKLFQTQKEAEKDAQKAKEQFDFVIKAKDEEIERWKEYRMGDSTKDLGESLEKYCCDAFDAVRADAYPNAYFKKDNLSVKDEGEEKGSKGDYIFRDFAPDGVELVSIMFDMKTEKDNTETKKTNESHLKKLDADRKKKGCEYAVLVSTLESDSNNYNRGIVDMSHLYEKTYVVRPQFFLAIIGLIRNMAKSTYAYKKQVVEYQRENYDISLFEEAVKQVADKVSTDYDNAEKQYDKVEKMCDDMIKKLQELKETYRLGQSWLGKAKNQLPNLDIRKLTHNNPTMREKFEQLDKNKEGE